VGWFNATKFNTYLHGLNWWLVEENEELTAQVNALHAQQGGGDISKLSNMMAMEREAEIEALKGKLETPPCPHTKTLLE